MTYQSENQNRQEIQQNELQQQLAILIKKYEDIKELHQQQLDDFREKSRIFTKYYQDLKNGNELTRKGLESLKENYRILYEQYQQFINDFQKNIDSLNQESEILKQEIQENSLQLSTDNRELAKEQQKKLILLQQEYEKQKNEIRQELDFINQEIQANSSQNPSTANSVNTENEANSYQVTNLDNLGKYQDIILNQSLTAAGIGGTIGAVVPGLDTAGVSATWIAMIIKIAEKAGHPVDEDAIKKFIINLLQGAASYLIGSNVLRGLLTLSGIGILPAAGLNALLNFLYTARLGIFIAEQYDRSGFEWEHAFTAAESIPKIIFSLPTIEELRFAFKMTDNQQNNPESQLDSPNPVNESQNISSLELLQSEHKKLKSQLQQELAVIDQEYNKQKSALQEEYTALKAKIKAEKQKIDEDYMQKKQRLLEEQENEVTSLEQSNSRQSGVNSAYLNNSHQQNSLPQIIFPELEVECPAIPFPVTPDEKDKYESLIDNSIGYVGGNYKNLEKNIEMANADFERKYYEERISQIEIERESVKIWVDKKYNEALNKAIAQLPLYYPEEPFDETGLNPKEIESERRKRYDKRKQLIEESANKLRQQKKELLDECKQRVDIFAEIAIKRCDNLIKDAKNKYEQAKDEEVEQKNQSNAN